MPIRHARYSDIPIMARVLAASFGPDQLFQIMFPRQNEYPDDFIKAFRRNMRVAWWDYSKVLMISYETPTGDVDDLDEERRGLMTRRDGRDEIITGLAEWQRVGLGWEHVWNVLGWWDPRNIISRLVQWRNRVLYLFSPCRASAQPTREDPNPLLFTNFISRLVPFSMHLLSDPGKPWRGNHWSLEILAVHPLYQAKGIGKDLVQWGLAKARCDTSSGVTSLPSVVISAENKEPFYQKMGFNELVGWSSRSVEGVEGVNPLEERGCGGGAVLWSWTREDEDLAKRRLRMEGGSEGVNKP